MKFHTLNRSNNFTFADCVTGEYSPFGFCDKHRDGWGDRDCSNCLIRINMGSWYDSKQNYIEIRDKTFLFLAKEERIDLWAEINLITQFSKIKAVLKRPK